MQYKPHDYQQYAINYILEHPIAAVILGMGLGKTSITLTAIEQLMYDSFEINKVLVVAPFRVARNTWSDEIHKWEHLKHLKYSIVLGTAADRKKALAADADIYVINRWLSIVVFLLILIWWFWMSFHPLRTGTANALRLL